MRNKTKKNYERGEEWLVWGNSLIWFYFDASFWLHGEKARERCAAPHFWREMHTFCWRKREEMVRQGPKEMRVRANTSLDEEMDCQNNITRGAVSMFSFHIYDYVYNTCWHTALCQGLNWLAADDLSRPLVVHGFTSLSPSSIQPTADFATGAKNKRRAQREWWPPREPTPCFS